jgi:hypothetical protein
MRKIKSGIAFACYIVRRRRERMKVPVARRESVSRIKASDICGFPGDRVTFAQHIEFQNIKPQFEQAYGG